MDRFKKEVGFIKSSSKKNIQYYQDSPSSDSFSSFQYDPIKDKHSQFSPYKHPMLKEDSFRPHQNPKNKSENNPILSNQHNPPKFSNLILRNNFTAQANDKRQKQAQVTKKPQEVGHHQYKKYKLQGHDEILYKQDDEFQQELSLSNLHKFQKSRQNRQTQDQVRQVEGRVTKQISKYKMYLQQSSSENEEQPQINIQNKQTLKSKNHRKQQEQLITEYDKKQFKDKNIKTAILQQNKQNPIKNKGGFQTKGGICFELDTRQFKGKPNTDLQMNRKKKKKQQSDPKVLLMQRRQTAKNYDRQARYKLFGY